MENIGYKTIDVSMKILFIAPRFHPNQLALVKKLQEEMHEVEFFVMGRGLSENYDLINPKQIPVSGIFNKCLKYVVRGKEIDFAKYAVIAMPKLGPYLKMIKGFGPDVIILRGASAPKYSWIAIIYGFINGIKIVFYTQGPKYVKEIGWKRRLHDWFFVKILKIHWFTPVLYRGVQNQSPKDLTYIDYVPFFLYPQRTIKESCYKVDMLRFLCVAKYEPRKNIKLLVEIFSKLRYEFSNFHLTIIGSTGTEKREKYFLEMNELINRLGMTENVTLLKNVLHENMEDYYLKHHVMVLPSIKEPASVSQLEAMSYGLAVICTSDNGTAHYISHGKNGFIIEATAQNLEKAIVFYLENIETALIHGRESLKCVNVDFSIENSYKYLIKTITR